MMQFPLALLVMLLAVRSTPGAAPSTGASSSVTDAAAVLRWVPAGGSPHGGDGFAAAYDSKRSCVVVFGGRSQEGTPVRDTWEWDSSNWVRRYPPSAPPAAAQGPMTYDSERGVSLLFVAGQTWEWDGFNWHFRESALVPGTREMHAMAYDPERRRVVLWGGCAVPSRARLNDTWEWDGSKWARCAPVGPVPESGAGVLAYCAKLRCCVLAVAGFARPQVSSTWTWDGARWHALRNASFHPTAPPLGLAEDLERGRLVLRSGGWWRGMPPGRTYEWDGSSWAERPEAPSARHAGPGVLLFDSSARRLLLIHSGDGRLSVLDWDGSAYSPLDPADPPSRRTRCAIAPEPCGRGLFLFGGEAEARPLRESWLLDAPAWRHLTPRRSPPARESAAIALDADRRRIVLFGGLGAEGKCLDDTWAYDGHDWSPVDSLKKPPGRTCGAMAYDSARHRILLFGGGSEEGWLGDTWELTGEGWRKRAPSVAPPARTWHAITDDPGRGRVVLFGGNASGVTADDTWEWDGQNWTEILTGSRPPPLELHGLGYEPGLRRVVVHGGRSSRPPLPPDPRVDSKRSPGSWSWDGTAWTTLAASVEYSWPNAAVRDVLALDPKGHRLTAVHDSGGLELREFNGKAWATPSAAPVQPSGLPGAPAAFYSPEFRGVVLFSGSSDRGDSWCWNGRRWSLIGSPAKPPGRFGAVAAYLSRARAGVLFGGSSVQYAFSWQSPRPAIQCLPVLDDTWLLEQSGWRSLACDHSPAGRRDAGMATDEQRGRVVLFGGRGSSGLLADTWEFDGSDWSLMPASPGPAAREGHAMAFDPVRRRVVMFGGSVAGPSATENDTWEWDGLHWEQRRPAHSPMVRMRAWLERDAVRNRLLLVGGVRSVAAVGAQRHLHDAWEWDGTDWSLRTIVNPPRMGELGEGACVLDPLRKRLVLFVCTNRPSVPLMELLCDPRDR